MASNNTLIEAAMSLFVDDVPEELKDQGFEIMKFAASASKTQQPCDVSPSFMVLKHLHKHPTKYDGTALSWIEDLPELKKDALKIYAGFLRGLPVSLSKAFQDDNVTQGWRKAGLVPYNSILTMQRCTTFSLMSPSQSHAITNAIGELKERAKLSGELTDRSLIA